MTRSASHAVRVTLSQPDPAWPALFAREAERIREALGAAALQLEHVGSTAVPELAAKPIIDVLLVVRDAADEASYAPSLEGAGYVLHRRDPESHEHRLFKRETPAVHAHVLSEGCPDIERMLAFRDRLRADAGDRALYLETKRRLAERTWRRMREYAEAKSEIIEQILARGVAPDEV